MIKVILNNNGFNFNEGITVNEIIKKLNLNYKNIIVAAIINNEIYELNDKVSNNSSIKFVTLKDELGNRIYRRSLLLLLAKSVCELYDNADLSIEHSLSNGIYCEIHKDKPLTRIELKNIEKYMSEMVEKNIEIKKLELSNLEAKKILDKKTINCKFEYFKQLNDKNILYKINDYYDYLFYNMVPNTSYLKKFKLHYRMPGFIVLFPTMDAPYTVPDFVDQPKLANIFLEYENLGENLGIEYVSDLNQSIESNDYKEIIRISESLHEKKIANIADMIYKNIETKKIALIAGPSSSGKTTFTHRLSTQLRINGIRPISISIDDYFVDREKTPVDKNGKYNFEDINAIDIQLLNKDLLRLLQGEKVEIPSFNFIKGKREYRGNNLKIDPDQIILIEGIHGLNDDLTNIIPENYKFKIYVSALTQLNINHHNRIPTTDTRLIRRIIRDNLFRGHDADTTIRWWPDVRVGEEKNIFPYQEKADIMFNSALIYELALLKKYIEPLLKKITKDQKSYYEAKRLLEILNCFNMLPDEDIPSQSIIREFIGKSSYRDD